MPYYKIILLFFFATTGLPGQSVGEYLNEMNTSPSMDVEFNREIDTLWFYTQEGKIDSLTYLKAVDSLFSYSQDRAGTITGDKAELYGYFLLTKFENYPAMVDRYEDLHNIYTRRTLTTTNELYRRAFLRTNNDEYQRYDYHMDSLARISDSETFRDFYGSEQELRLGDKAPNFIATSLAKDTIELAALIGKVVVLDFWATWCVPCIKDLPELQQLHQRFADSSDVVMISISKDSDLSRLRRFVAEEKIEWIQIQDVQTTANAGSNSGNLSRLYRAKGIPKYFVIDRYGIIQYNSELANRRPVSEDVLRKILSSK